MHSVSHIQCHAWRNRTHLPRPYQWVRVSVTLNGDCSILLWQTTEEVAQRIRISLPSFFPPPSRAPLRSSKPNSSLSLSLSNSDPLNLIPKSDAILQRIDGDGVESPPGSASGYRGRRGGEQRAHALHLQSRRRVSPLSRVEPNPSHLGSTTGSQAHVRFALLSTIVHCQDGPHHVRSSYKFDLLLWMIRRLNLLHWSLRS